MIAKSGSITPSYWQKELENEGVNLRLIELGEETSPELVKSFPQNERAKVKVGQVGKLLKELKKLGAGYAVMAGRVTPGKLFKGLHPDIKLSVCLQGLNEKMRDHFWCHWR